MRSPAVRRVLAVGALLLVSGGCGDQTGPADRIDGVEAPVTIVDGEVKVTCGGPASWLPSQMADGIASDLSRDELADALGQGIEAFGPETAYSVPDWPNTPWRLLAESADELTFGLDEWTHDGPLDRAMTFTVRRDGDGWTFAGSGDCQLRPLLDEGVSWAEVTAETALDPAASVLTVGVNELSCTGSRDPLPFLRDPVLIETEETVTVYWTSTPPEGAQTCPGNPTVSQKLSLDAPLGDRPLLDGSRWPPTPIGS